jgi:DNA-directed RNA polymerase specialized sigma24 family protein
MNNPPGAGSVRLLAALRANEPDALAALFDAYGGRLFRYCWLALRNRDLALIALRDTLAVAQAHASRLTDPALLDSWLYALAQGECRRRRPVPPADADEPPARPSQPDADSRLMAWNAVMGMAPDEIEVLDLACRHDVELGLVLGMPDLQARALLARARENLQRALGAEILVSRVSHGCPDRARVLRGWAGVVTPDLRERVLRHAGGCPVCGPALPRNVSATRVFALLPDPAWPAGARQQILAFFGDRSMSAYREFAVTRAADFDAAGFPLSVPPLSVPPFRRLVPRRRLLTATVASAAAAAVAAAAVAVVLAGPGTVTRSQGRPPVATATGTSVPRREGAGAEAATPAPTPTPAVGWSPLTATPSPVGQLFVKVTHPLPARRVSGTQIPPPFPPPRLPRTPQAQASGTGRQPQGSLAVSPDALRLGYAAQGELTITGSGATETWSASTSSGAVTLSAYSGTLLPGQSETLTVSVSRVGGAGGDAVITVDQGTLAQQTAAAQNIPVTWSQTWSPAWSGSRPPRPGPPLTPRPAPPRPVPPRPAPRRTPPRSGPPHPAPSPTAPSVPSPTVSAPNGPGADGLVVHHNGGTPRGRRGAA